MSPRNKMKDKKKKTEALTFIVTDRKLVFIQNFMGRCFEFGGYKNLELDASIL